MWAAWLLACTGEVPDGTSVTDDETTTGDTAPGPPGPTGDTGTPGGSHSGVPVAPPVITSGPTLSLPTATQLRLVQILSITTDVPTAASVVLDDGARRRRVNFPGLATGHELPLLELHQLTTYDVEVTLTNEAGGSVVSTASFQTSAVPELMPRLDLLVNEPTAEPGLRVLPLEADGLPSIIVALDRSAQPVWVAATVGDTKATSFEPSTGRLSWLTSSVVWRMTPAGMDQAIYASARRKVPGAFDVDLPGFHHEAAFEADGSFWSFYKEDRYEAEYPLTEARPEFTGPKTISTDVVAHVAADGTVLGLWPLADLFPTDRIGYYAVSGVETDGDWSHANALVPLSGEDAFLVSMRHQDTVARVTASTGAIEWILANHDGWPASHQPYLLTPVGDPFLWQYHQHAPALDAQGGLWLYDNGNEHRTTPYSQTPQPGPDYSRVVRFEVDPVARTVRQTFSFANDVPSPLYSELLGNADPLPVTGHVLVTFPALNEEDGVDNHDLGRGQRTTRVREIDPATGVVVWDVRASTDMAVNRGGYKTDRAISIPSLYPPDVTEEWLP